jgi:hypothetical protein
MFPTTGYASLLPYDSSRDSSEELGIGSNTSKEIDYKRKSNIIHWLIHAVAILILSLVFVLHLAGPSSATCWKLYNYYCK